MFGRKHKIVSDIDTLIGEGTVITGDIHFSGGLRVDGRICGSIVSANGKQHSLLVLSEQGMIEGKIKVPYIVINGTVRGPIHCDESLELQPAATISGRIFYKTIKIHQGAVIEGKWFAPRLLNRS
ncbi:MAG: polymer-forming cytoskeletal protein [Nitrosomonas sp.]|nr:polymer-forming cytoskeletal protein [Nitrosomonas sp.]